jgi:hypothetical protein
MKLPDRQPDGLYEYTESQMKAMYRQGLEDAVELALQFTPRLENDGYFRKEIELLKEQAN